MPSSAGSMRSRTISGRLSGFISLAAVPPVMPVFSVVQESAALGCAVEWADRSNWPTCTGQLAQISADIHIPDDVLNRPEIQCVLDALGILKRRWGDDVAVIGWDNIEDGRYFVPGLSTVAPDLSALADKAMDALIARIEGSRSPGTSYVVPHRLLVRESS